LVCGEIIIQGVEMSEILFEESEIINKDFKGYLK